MHWQSHIIPTFFTLLENCRYGRRCQFKAWGSFTFEVILKDITVVMPPLLIESLVALRMLCSQTILVLGNDTVVKCLIEDIDFCSCELPCANLSLEQQIQLGKSPASWFRHTEERVDAAQEGNAGPEESRVIAPVPSARIDHVWSQDRADDSDDDVQVAAEDYGLDLQATSRNLSD